MFYSEQQTAQAFRAVYVVWFSMIATDAGSRWNWTGGILEDPRVVRFWDVKKKIGRLYAGKDPESDDTDVVWDTFDLLRSRMLSCH